MPLHTTPRKRRILIEDEGQDEAVSRPPSKRQAAPNAAKPATTTAQAASSSSTKLKLICGGKVYRSLAESSPPKALKLYDASTGLLGEPDEKAVQRKRRRLITPEPNGDVDVEIEAPTPPRRNLWPALPTPPSSTRSRSPIDPFISTDFNLEAICDEVGDGLDPLTVLLPEIYETLLSLHSALERALVLHLATEGGKTAGVLATTTTDADGAMRARLHNIITFRSLRNMVERGSGKRFGANELAKLKWLWDLERPLGYTVSKMRELDASGNGKRVNVLGVGVELVVQHNVPMPAVELVSGPPSSPSRKVPTKTGGRDSMSIVALWSQAGEARITEVRRRLGAFAIWQIRKQALISPSLAVAALPTPPSSATKRRKSPTAQAKSKLRNPMPIPSAELPELQSRSTSDTTQATLAPPQMPSPAASPAKKASGSLDTRASSQLERIKARQAAKAARRATVTLSSESGETIQVDTPAARMGELRERSALSRLAMVADAVYMLFSPTPGLTAPPSPSASMPNPPNRKRRSVPLDEAVAVVAKSSRLSLSDGEARDALYLLERVCPGFAAVRDVDRRPWLTSLGEMSLRSAKEAIKSALASRSS